MKKKLLLQYVLLFLCSFDAYAQKNKHQKEILSIENSSFIKLFTSSNKEIEEEIFQFIKIKERVSVSDMKLVKVGYEEAITAFDVALHEVRILLTKKNIDYNFTENFNVKIHEAINTYNNKCKKIIDPYIFEHETNDYAQVPQILFLASLSKGFYNERLELHRITLKEFDIYFASKLHLKKWETY